MENKNFGIKAFISEICIMFPEVNEEIEKRSELLGYDAAENMFTEMMEAFSQCTTNAIKKYDEHTASSHLKYMSEKLVTASDIEREYIDVYYVESLMWDIQDHKTRRWGWSIIPENLKVLYQEMWGEPKF
jgi:hypothetical protein